MPRQLNVAREATDDETEIRPLDLVRRVPGGDLPTPVENALGEFEKLRLEGPVLRNRLEAVRERYRLSVQENSDRGAPRQAEVIRIVCSDGLVG